MGYDNECIVNIQALPGEYFCPVCRTLIYPNEALQSQCTHLFCKPCLAYVVATTHACPYDGYLVTEADSKPLVESSKELAETIGKVAVHCLYHRSGCQWQGTLAESTAHGTECTYGNSPVVCNRCGTQIVHRQVQEHAQICPGIQPQAGETTQAQAPVANQATTQDPSAATAATAAPSAQTSAPVAAPGQAQAQAPTPEQWYQQQPMQYQQYYQQYPGYDSYQQQYQQYAQYQQQGYPQYPLPQMAAPQPYMQQPQPQPGQPQAQPQPQPQPQLHPQPQAQPQVPVQVPQMQGQQPFVPPQQPHPHSQPQPHPPQQFQQPQPHATQARQPQMQAPPQHQLPIPPQQFPPQQMPLNQPRPQQPLPHPQQPPMQMQPQPHPHGQPVPQMQPPQPPAHAVSGHQSYPQPLPGPPQQRPPHMHPQQQGMPPGPPQHPPHPQSQFPLQQPPQMRPPQPQMPMPAQQQPPLPPAHGPQAYQQTGMQQHGFPQPQGQGSLHPGQMPQHQIQPQQSARPQGLPYMQHAVPGHPHPQMNAPSSQGLPPQQPPGRPVMNQQSPSQNYMGRPGSMQQSQLPHSGSQGGLVPTSPATPKQLSAKGLKSGEKLSENASDSKSKSEEAKGAAKVKEENDGQTENDNKDVPETLAKEDTVDGQSVKPVKVEEGLGELSESSRGVKADGREKEMEGRESKNGDKAGSNMPLQLNIERTNQSGLSDGQNMGNAVNSVHPQQMQAPGVLERVQMKQQPPHQNVFPAQGHGYPSQFPQHQLPPGPPPQVPYENPSHMPDSMMVSQRPPAPDRMFPQPMHQPGQERRFPEPSPHPMHVPGQAVPPGQMRPPGHESFPHPGQMAGPQEHFWPPPHAGVPPGQGLPPPPPPPGAVPSQGHMHPPHLGARTAPGEPLPRPMLGGPPPGAMDAPGRMMGGPPFIPEDKLGRPAAVNAMEAEAHAIRSGAYDPHRPPPEHASYGPPNNMKINGMHDSAFPHGMPDDRFRPYPEERFKPFPDDGFKAAHDEHYRHVSRREFQEDLKQFPRPAHLDGEGPPRFDGYSSSSRPLDRMPLQPGSVNGARPAPSYQSGPPFPPSIDRPVALHEHLGRKHDETFPHPDRLPDFGHHRVDGFPPLRSPGQFGGDIPDGLPGQPRRGLDGPRSHGLPSDIRGSETIAPSFSRGGGFGGFRNHLDMGEHGMPGNMPSHFRSGDPGFNDRFGLATREGDFDAFEQSRKRKAGSTVRCLICKIDCETVGGLEHHSQGREHQKTAMELVMNIKKENAKKHKQTSGNASPFEEANKSRKSSFEKRANRQ